MKSAIYAIAGFVLVYAVGAFVFWEFNPGLWAMEWRFIVAFFGVYLAGLGYIHGGEE